MGLVWLELRDFRSYRSLRWEPDPSVNVLVGRNAAGKTNLLEAVGYLASLRSFRRVPDAEMVAAGVERCVVRGQVEQGDAESLVEVEIPVAGRRRAQLNRRRLTRSADLLGAVRTIVFLPDDLDFVKRGPSYRRDLLDATAVQIWPGAHRDQQDYERALRQRNALLRQQGRGADPATLEVWDGRLSQAGGKLMDRRQATIAALQEETAAMYRKLSASETAVRLEYRAGWAQAGEGDWRDRLAEALRRSRPDDMERRASTVGPHRDDLVMRLGERDSRTRASQGEQRTLALAVRLAAHAAVRNKTGGSPLLLLDDVFSELDAQRAAALAGALPQAQTIITTARADEAPVGGRRWLVGEGAVR